MERTSIADGRPSAAAEQGNSSWEPPATYDLRAGIDYARLRRPDPRIVWAIERALGRAKTVVNVGAGTGSYEPSNRKVLAVDPSVSMLRQRPPGAAPAVIAAAEQLPMVENSVDAALAIMTIHHWADPRQGVLELKRVARERVVVFTWDPAMLERFWLSDYFPQRHALHRDRFPTIESLVEWLGETTIERVSIPADCRDGFCGAYWQRPDAYLDPDVRAGMSSFQSLAAAELECGLSRLRADLDSGAWKARYGARLRGRTALDVGYRLLVCELKGERRTRS